MNIRKIIPLLALLLLTTQTDPAQTTAPKEPARADEAKKAQEAAEKKREAEKKALALVEELIKEAPSLRLAENRIRVQATVADLLWKHDEKRARGLFKQAKDAFREVAQSEPQAIDTRGNSPVINIIQSRYQLRQDILKMLTRRDAKLARDFLRATRRPSQEAEAAAGDDEESQWEMNFAAQIAATDPGQALEIAQESLKKGYPHQLVNVVFQLRAKDGESGDKLVSDIMKKLRSTSLSTDRAASDFAFAFLTAAIHNQGDRGETAKPAASALDTKTLQELMEMIIAAVLSKSPDASNDLAGKEGYYNSPDHLRQLQVIMPDVEKYAPARAPALRKMIAEVDKTLDPRARAYREYEAMAQSGDIEALLEAAAKSPPEIRSMLTYEVIARAANEGDLEKATKLMNEFVADPNQRKHMFAQIERQGLWHAANLGKLDEARQLMSRLAPEERATALAHFAVTALRKGDKKTGLQLLEEARGCLGAQATNFMEMNALLQVARVYAGVEPVRSFEIIEPMIDQFNLLINAAAVLDGFEQVRYLKDGELIPQGHSALMNSAYQCVRDFAPLARGDLDRAKLAADRFLRNEVRILARLHVAQGVLSDALPDGVSEGVDIHPLFNTSGN